ncbi:DUF4232 domain-containing protein [Streptomyces rectiverticillatus]|uniref:DUF4232 domain-containing protein n=1 Tax=Streptomyces rectiverticillatus TaxID=173860 RepID=UPI0015C3D2F2|nr:DUF4232 domain-containing protein [Streptomyces rectiverticillatus]QLE75672.1 DUF4232 domain-containing protein [Streptomyces rectiverticillatus]
MFRDFRALPLALTGVLLLTACGSQVAGAGEDGPARRQASGSGSGSGSPGSSGDSSCGTRASGAASAPGSPAVPGGTARESGKGGVTITGVSPGTRPCAGFEVANDKSEPFTYTITFTFTSDSGEALETVKESVPSVGPGQTVKRTVTMSERGPGGRTVTGVRVTKVRSVPAAEAPTRGGTCPSSGVHVDTDEGDAAMGLRVVGLLLQNCGTRPYRLNGYPQLQLLDGDHRPVDGVKILRGGSAIATGTGADGEPQQLVLQPGEWAHSGLVWRNITGGGDAVNLPYVRVRPQPGAPAVTVTPELDLGTTGKLGVGPWKKDETRAPGGAGTSGAQTPDRPSAPRPSASRPSAAGAPDRP